MFEINAENAAEYLRSSGYAGPPSEVKYDVRELAGGVSNVVLLATPAGGGEPLVLKQACGRLRVKEEWLCPVERIWREIDVLRICGDVLGIKKVCKLACLYRKLLNFRMRCACMTRSEANFVILFCLFLLF